MPHRQRPRWWTLFTFLVVGSFICLAAPLAAAPVAETDPNAIQSAFAAAAQEFGVPESVLLAVAYNESRWEHHDGEPSTSGGYGVMHLTDIASIAQQEAKGEDLDAIERSAVDDASANTLHAAAELLGLHPEALKQDAAQNIRGGAALLAQYARETVGTTPAAEADWYGAVAKYSGSQEADVALGYANTVFATINRGSARTTSEGQQVTLAAASVEPNTSTADSLHLRNTKYTGADCPNGLACRIMPAAYVLNNPKNLSDYGNYDLADREADGLDIQYIVIHDTETPYVPTIRLFQNPRAYVSSHYVLRASDGQITQMVDNKNVAWTAGNWYINSHSINFEHEGYAIEGATWYSERMYQQSARLVRYLAQKYDIPLDRAHIIGHDDVPGMTRSRQAGMHWDPGPFWDWAHYMTLMGAPINPSSGDRDSNIVTINPNFATNQPLMTYCYTSTNCREVPRQSASFVYLRTAPSFSAPYIINPYINPAQSYATRANNWANKAATGQQFYRVERQGDWDAIYFSGQKAWFYNPDNSNTTPGSGTLVTPKAGLASIAVYGRAYPEASAYPPGITPQPLEKIYDIPAGQIYVSQEKVKADYYAAPVYRLNPAEHTVVEGQTEYYLIFFNHRFGFVKASDVDVVNP
ncbi:MAG TPA: peptidoglycan recognition family protein [Herpetosiphonaceae bacterium]